jgi:hypothetical protein
MTEKAFLRLLIGIGIVVGHSAHHQEVKDSNTATRMGQLQIVLRMFSVNSTVVDHHREVKGSSTTTGTRRVDIK